MESLAQAVEAADGVWPVLAIFIIGLYVLIWKFGGTLLVNIRKNGNEGREASMVAQDVLAETQQIAKNIVTNHGSRNIGHAIDMITELLTGLRTDLSLMEEATGQLRKQIDAKLEDVIDRLGALEAGAPDAAS